ncbi:MAG: hypothetical protein ACOCXJ_03205 [Planctomycetota bacterium]
MADTLDTCEIRWFLGAQTRSRWEELARAVVPEPDTDEARIDCYAPGANHAIATKLRDGFLQVKVRIDRPRPMLCGPVSGFLERYRKVSSRWDEDHGRAAERPCDLDWVQVRKHRRECRSGPAEVEATEVRLRHMRWLSIGIEASGDALGQVELERQCYRLGESPLLWGLLVEENCMGYGGWLQQMDDLVTARDD